MAAKRKSAKFALVLLLIFGGLLVITGNLFKIQIIEGDIYKEQAKKQHEAVKPLEAKRGDIVDRNGKLLVTSTELYTVAVDPFYLKDTMRLCQILAIRTDTTVDYYRKKIIDCKNHYVELARNISENDVKAIKALADRGILEIPHQKRKYIHGKAASQVIGLTNIDAVGVGGLELRYNEELQGQDGKLFCQRDAIGHLYLSPALQHEDAHDGHTLKLTIDVDLQKIVEYELEEGVKFFEARSGTVVAVDPKTGEVLAMASYPDFNPMDRASTTFDKIRNRTVTDQYEPGSTFKMITAAAALEEGIIAEDDTVDGNNGQVKIYDRIIRDSHPLGKMTFTEAIEQSSNVVFATLANKIEEAGGASKFYKYIRDFGFGVPTGIDMRGEISGQLPKPKNFSGVTTAYIGHGYGVDVTPIQLTMAYSAIANDGILMKPHIVKEIRTADGDLVQKNKPEMIRKVIDKENARRLRKMFVGVVEQGTGKKAKVEGMHIAGKTGTSKQLDENRKYTGYNYNASFIGMYPAEKPEVVMLVLIDRPKTYYYGGSVAGPIFRNITARWVSSNHFLAQNNYIIDSVLKISHEELPEVLIPNVVGLQTGNAKQYLDELDYSMKSKRGGVIRSQNPMGGDVAVGHKHKIEVKTFSNEIGLEKNNPAKEKPNIIGLTKRQALAVLHSSGYKTISKGSGSVYKQVWRKTPKNEEECLIRCR